MVAPPPDALPVPCLAAPLAERARQVAVDYQRVLAELCIVEAELLLTSTQVA